jgi:3-methyladenine DNA glycosylase AlkD
MTTRRPTTRRREPTPTVDQVARAIILGLRRLRDPVKAAQSQKYFKDEIVALGVDTPTLRAFVKAQARPLVRQWDVTQAVECCDRLLQEPELEIQAAGLLLLGAFKKGFTLDLLAPSRKWLGDRLDNWALVDGFCGAVLSPLLERNPELKRTLRVWSKDDSLWVRRAALVALVPFARRGDLLDTTYALVAEHFKDPEDLMHKAMGWLLREAGKTDAERLRRFLLKHGPAIPRTTLRYAIERFAPADRKRLLEATRMG